MSSGLAMWSICAMFDSILNISNQTILLLQNMKELKAYDD